MMTLSQYLKSQAETQANFAERVGMTQGNVAKLCGAAPKLSIETALKIERVTGGSVPLEAWPQFAALSSRSSAEGDAA